MVDESLIGNKSIEGLTFWFHLYGSNYHNCSMAGNAKVIASNIYQYRERECELRISESPKKIEIEDVGGHCKLAGHCGLRAYIGKAEFQ